MKLAEGDLGRMRFRFERFYAGGFSLNAELTPEGDNISALMKPAPGTPEQPAETAAEAASGTAPVLQIADLEIAADPVPSFARQIKAQIFSRMADGVFHIF